MKKAIIVDIDGTLSNCEHRQPLLRQEPKDWKTFHSLVHLDTVNGWCRDLMTRYYYVSIRVILVSGRTRESLEATVEWMNQYNVLYDEIFVREQGDYRNDDVFKKEVYDTHIKGNYDVLFVLEDRRRVVEMWRKEGLVCLQCAEGDF